MALSLPLPSSLLKVPNDLTEEDTFLKDKICKGLTFLEYDLHLSDRGSLLSNKLHKRKGRKVKIHEKMSVIV